MARTSGEVSNFNPWRGVSGISILRYVSPSWPCPSGTPISWYQSTWMYQWKHKSFLLRLEELLPWLGESAVTGFIPAHHRPHHLLQAKELLGVGLAVLVNGWNWWTWGAFPTLMIPWFCAMITDHPKWLMNKCGVCCPTILCLTPSSYWQTKVI